ncbi:hypothetical protein TWF102_001818 [Orbilia oligospora]|uniref:Uncharacterized protein n=1 Tax=Orbilia oligospora TaxID=2813651 RepID=A0A7C8JA94_ORBOL|nr:hypothetical protein TWF102_001818 [Orbilia oligospora]KAF3136875.1 hypothetical protein TWF594_007762 [Orbilia oligospora]
MEDVETLTHPNVAGNAQTVATRRSMEHTRNPQGYVFYEKCSRICIFAGRRGYHLVRGLPLNIGPFTGYGQAFRLQIAIQLTQKLTNCENASARFFSFVSRSSST